MKSIFVGLVLLIGIANCHYFCSSNNLVVLENPTKPEIKCDIPRQYLLTLLEIDQDNKIEFSGQDSFNINFKESYPEKKLADANDAACNERSIPDCVVTWNHISGGKIDIKIEVGKEM